MRNVRHIAKSRVLMWWMLGFSSLPLHFLYNSAVYSTKASNNLNILSVTPDFLNGGRADIAEAQEEASRRKNIYTKHRSQDSSFSWLNDTVDHEWGLGNGWDFDLQGMCDQDCIKRYQEKVKENYFRHNLTREDCLKTYLTAFGNRQDVLVVSTRDLFHPSRPLNYTNNSLLFFANFTGFPSKGRYWQCASTNTLDCRKREGWTPQELDSWNIIGYRIDYCLSSERNAENQCKVNYNLSFMISVCVANLCKCIGLVGTVFLQYRRNRQCLITVGDAIASFLNRGDHSTRDMCLLDRTSLEESHSTPPMSFSLCRSFPFIKREVTCKSAWSNRRAREWRPLRWRYFRLASRRRWASTIAIYILHAGCAAYILQLALDTISTYTQDLGVFVKMGFGTMNEFAKGYLNQNGNSIPNRLLCIVLFANTGQFLTSMIYVQSNCILSTMLADREWNQYATHRKPLRVTSPSGLQRSSYFISVPWKFSIPMLVISWGLHFAYSQGVFLIVIENLRGNGTVSSIEPTVVFSVWALITTMLFLILIAAYLAVIASRTQICRMPQGATCSAVISAACHQPLPDDRDASCFPLKWGAVTDEEVRFRLSSPPVVEANQQIPRDSISECDAQEQTEEEFFQSDGIKWVRPGHCCFSTANDVQAPTPGSLYA